MKVAILTRPDNKSPRILANSLSNSLEEIGVESYIIYDMGFLRRLVPFSRTLRFKTNLHYRIQQKLINFFEDRKLVNRLKAFDAIVVCECIPNAFWRNYYDIERLKRIIKRPMGLYEVFFLESAPHFMEKLNKNNDYINNLYNFELAISRVSYTNCELSNRKFEIGLNLKSMGLEPQRKSKLTALLDFEWDGENKYINEQIKVLRELGVEFVQLKGTYAIEEIRELYKKCGIFFIQHFESFGLPISECLAYGAIVFTPNSGWPMAFRLNKNLEVYGTGELAECFVVYNGEDDLKLKLLKYIESFDTKKCHIKNFETYINNYPHFYNGNIEELLRFKKLIKSNEY